MRELLDQGFAALGLTPSPTAVDQLLLYADRLLTQNQVMNLTAITQPEQVAELHFLDSAALLTYWSAKGRSLIDVGTGGGFPGLVLKILEPTLQLTLLDSLGKRVDWLASLCRELGFTDVVCLHARAEELAHDPTYRDGFDAATSRAVASLPLLCELCLPYVKPGGVLLAMKSEKAREEVSQAARAISVLQGGAPSLQDYALPLSGAVRCLVTIPKAHPTPKGYPRRWSKMQKARI